MEHGKNYVDHNDRDQRTNEIRLLFNQLRMNVDYVQTDMMVRALDLYDKLKGKVSINDIAKMQREWEKKWTAYFENKKKPLP